MRDTLRHAAGECFTVQSSLLATLRFFYPYAGLTAVIGDDFVDRSNNFFDLNRFHANDRWHAARIQAGMIQASTRIMNYPVLITIRRKPVRSYWAHDHDRALSQSGRQMRGHGVITNDMINCIDCLDEIVDRVWSVVEYRITFNNRKIGVRRMDNKDGDILPDKHIVNNCGEI